MHGLRIALRSKKISFLLRCDYPAQSSRTPRSLAREAKMSQRLGVVRRGRDSLHRRGSRARVLIRLNWFSRS